MALDGVTGGGVRYELEIDCMWGQSCGNRIPCTCVSIYHVDLRIQILEADVSVT
jgi:hypothetical protein